MKGIFVTGTDTSMGKTVLTAALVAGLKQRGVDVVPMKPVQAGCDVRKDQMLAPDLEFCIAAGGLSPSEEEKALMCPYKLEPACSPRLAASMAKTEISLKTIRKAFDALSRKHQVVVAEGAGGVLAPINDSEFMLDIMKALGLPVLVAARPGLGTINHTLLSVRALRDAGLEIAGVVLVDAIGREWGAIEKDNVTTIGKLGKVETVLQLPFLGRLAPGSGPAAFEGAFEALAPVLNQLAG